MKTYRVEFVNRVTEYCYSIIEAENEEEARQKWNDGTEGYEVESRQIDESDIDGIIFEIEDNEE